jgi:ferric-dicitrate binding protein FerR (iron transport regulator)
MNSKPDEATLMAYLYGELDAQEAEKVKAYLDEHPEEASALREKSFVREALRHVSEQEVIAPPILFDQPRPQSRWLNGTVKTSLGIAAAVVVMLAAGKLLGPEVRVADGELRISFGKPLKDEQPVVAPLSRDEVQTLIRQSLDENNETLQTSWRQEQAHLQTLVRNTVKLNDSKLSQLMAATGQASTQQIEGFVATLQKENLKMMQDYLSLTSSDQKKYMEGLLVDFSKYLQEQRNQDLNALTTRLSSLEKNNSQFREETGQILATILTASGPTTKKQVNY